MRKRTLVAILLGSLLLTLAGCGAKPQGTQAAGKQGNVTIRYGWFGNPDQEPVAKAMVDAFNQQNPNITVQLENIPYKGYWEKLTTAVAGGTAPDVLRLTNYWGYLLGKNGAAVDLTPYLPSDYLADFDPALLSYAAPGGKVYGIPQSNNVQVLVYNKDMLAKAGVTAPTTPETAWTWDELMNVCRQVQAKGAAPYCYGIYSGAPQGRLINLYQNGGGIVNSATKQVLINSPESVKDLGVLKAMYDGKLVSPNAWTADYDPLKEFMAGNLAIFHGGNFNLATLEKNMPGKYGVTFLPRNPKTISMVGGEVYSVTKNSKHPKEAAKLVEFMSNPDNMTRWSKATMAIPPRKSLMGKIDYGAFTGDMNLIAKAAEFGSTPILTEFQAPGWGTVDTLLRERTIQLWTMPAQQWADAVAADISKAVNS